MARIFIDGFEGGNEGNWDSLSGTSWLTFIAAPAGMSGSYAARFYSGGSDLHLNKFLPSHPVEFYTSSRVQKVNTNNRVMLARYWFSGTAVIEIFIETTGYIRVALRPTQLVPTYIAISDTSLSIGTVYHVETRTLLSPTVGIVQVKVNNVVVLNYSGNTRSDIVEAYYDTVSIGAWVGLQDVYFDDVVFDSEEWVGPSRIARLAPIGAGALTQFTPSAGDNWQCVDEAPPSDADYVATDIIDTADLYTLSDLPGDALSVKSVQLSTRAFKEVGSTPQNIQMAVRSNGSNYFSADKQVPDTVGVNVTHLFETNPDTGVAWTVGQVNALEGGMKAVT